MIAITIPPDYREMDSTPAVVEVASPPTATAGEFFVTNMRPVRFTHPFADLVEAACAGIPLTRSEELNRAAEAALSRTGDAANRSHDLARELARFND